MTNTIQKDSASYIVSNKILDQKNKFTIEDIFNGVRSELSKFISSIEEMIIFIKRKVTTLCEVGLVSDTGLFYYVTAKSM